MRQMTFVASLILWAFEEFFLVLQTNVSVTQKRAPSSTTAQRRPSLPSPLLRTRLLVVRSLLLLRSPTRPQLRRCRRAEGDALRLRARARSRVAYSGSGAWPLLSSPLLSSLEVNPLFVYPPSRCALSQSVR